MTDIEERNELSPQMTVLSLINGMIGGFILILPVFALQTGFISTMIVIIVTGIFSYYSCHLCILHIGKQPDLDSAIYKHFDRSSAMKKFYDLCVWSSLLLIDFLYFELIVIQWIGLAPPHSFTITNAVLNAGLLLVISLAMKYFEFGANLMAYGIISIACYLIFLVWVVASQDTSKPAEYKAFGSGFVQLAAGMGQAFAIQAFFVPVLKKSKNAKGHLKYVVIAYIAGGIAYSFIAFMGSYGILHRDYLGYSDGQRTIQGFFGVGTWQVNTIQIIYLLHLYSVFPQFLLISKKRLFGVLNYESTPKGNISIIELFYIALSIGVCLAITLLKISIRDIIDFNGAVAGCIFVYFIPAALHLKCLYFSKGKVPIGSQMKEKNEAEKEKYVVMVEQANAQSDKQTEEGKQTPKKDKEIEMAEFSKQQGNRCQKVENTEEGYQCDCSKENYSKRERLGNLIMTLTMIALGLFIMIDGIRSLLED